MAATPTPTASTDPVQQFLADAQTKLTAIVAAAGSDLKILRDDAVALLQIAADDLPAIEGAINTIATITAVFVPGGQAAPFFAKVANTVLELDKAVLTAQGVIMTPQLAQAISPQVLATSVPATNEMKQQAATAAVLEAFPAVPADVIGIHVKTAVAQLHRVAPAAAK